ncbi:MAG: MFS transporter [Thermodesulfobacteriota bacterium]|nr:MFS transporter [Thermodesulfobacteriota bacterium]
MFFGAFNDNLFRNGLLILIAYGAAGISGGNSDILINISAGLFILPFFLFSATAGQMADKYEKAVLIQRIKMAEILIMCCAAIAFYLRSVPMLIFLLFLMGTQSAFFGPIKYSIIPDHLKPGEIVGGNAMVEMGTFVAILLGLVAGGKLSQIDTSYLIGATVILIAVLGWLSSLFIPKAVPPSPDLKININPLTQTWKTIQYGRRVHSVFLSIMAVSWFWFLGMAYVTQLPNFTKLFLKGTEDVYILLMVMFTVGIALGSMLCEKMSDKKVELGLVPLGSIGLSIFGFDLFFAYTPPSVNGLMGIGEFLATDGSIRVLFDLLMVGVFGGFYSVPLFAFIQKRTEPEYRARVIAASNILNALFMVAANITAVLLIGMAGLTIPQFFLVLAIMNVAVAVYIYKVVPEFVIRFIIWILTHTMYRVRHIGLDNIPDEGPVVLACNHVSYVDGLLIAGSCRRPPRFVMFKPIFKIPVLRYIFKTGKAIPIDSKKNDPETYARSFELIAEALDDGQVVCIFPEGKLTADGEIDEFKNGIEKILKRNPVPVVPIALRGLWGSYFSRQGGKAFKRETGRKFWSRVELVADTAIPPGQVTAKGLREIVMRLRGDRR